MTSLSAKTLDPRQVGVLLENPATENPLFLLVALEELRGFGSFSSRERGPRKGRNPANGDPVDVPATRIPYFKLGKDLLKIFCPFIRLGTYY